MKICFKAVYERIIAQNLCLMPALKSSKVRKENEWHRNEWIQISGHCMRN